MKRASVVLVLAFLVAFLAACENTADSRDRQRTDQQLDLYEDSQPIPKYDYSLPREIMIKIQTIRTAKVVATWTIFTDAGRLMDMCPSMGYPIPSGTQLTNPLKRVETLEVTIDQAEMDGLYYPSEGGEATWVLCVNADGTLEPRYSEPKVMTFGHPVEIDYASNRIIHKPPTQNSPSIQIQGTPTTR